MLYLQHISKYRDKSVSPNIDLDDKSETPYPDMLEKSEDNRSDIRFGLKN
jgi:hypothetical protein